MERLLLLWEATLPITRRYEYRRRVGRAALALTMLALRDRDSARQPAQ